MNVLLLSMPDSFEHMPAVAIRMPNGALASLAGNVDSHHRVAVADLILVQSAVRPTLERLLRDVEPHVVGLSTMTFQRGTALTIARVVRALRPSARIVVGGYDPSLAPEAYESCPEVDFIVRGEGEHTLCELLRAMEEGPGPDPGATGGESSRFSGIPGLSYRTAGGFVRNVPRQVIPLASSALRLPDRGARVLGGYTMLGRGVDVVETSRGCTFDCSFCSIIEMRGRNFHPYPIDRVLADIADARRHGAEAIFFVDDNITLDVDRFEALCQAIIDAGFDDADYIVQAMTAPIAQHGARLAPLMRKAGFRYVFLGIENILDEDLGFLRARAKNARREKGRTIGNASIEAIAHLHRHGMYVVGGLIVGNPSDTRESIEANLEFARRYVDWPYIQHPTPYPRTPMTRDFRERGLIVDEDVAHYDGTTAVVRSAEMAAEEIEFMRWRAERWMKMKHLPATFLHSPMFVLANGLRMLAHTFAGTTLRSAVGLEEESAVFARFRARRRAERDYIRAEPPGNQPAAREVSDGAGLARC
uniref:Fe-S protein radical SAM family protein n=1 Tax=uncultured bacterium 213 TaxID=698383 RepID=E3T6X0_9BACT|nr:Fe-S protein radical SAM family protein [uncultured bacterium 213]